MDSGQDLIIEMRKARKELIESVNDMKAAGRFLATAERDYKIALRKEILKLHVEQKVAWTACFDLAVGEEKVAELRYKRDIQKSSYAVAEERINAIKLELRLLENEINKEWGRVG